MGEANAQDSSDYTALYSVLGEFDDRRIINDEISDNERSALENILINKFAEKAAKEEKKVILLKDEKEYMALKRSGEIFDGESYCLLVDDKGQVIDMAPIAYHMIDTPEGSFYGKLMTFK